MLRMIFLSLALISQISYAQNNIETSLGVDGYVRHTNREIAPGVQDEGFSHLIRLRADLTNQDKVSVKTRTIVSGQKWQGDYHSAYTTGKSNDDALSRGSEGVQLDYAFLELPVEGWLFRGGRQEAAWGNCFTNCDDRRDRLFLLAPWKPVTTIFIYDKRNALNNEGDMYAVAFLKRKDAWNAGLLIAGWTDKSDSYILKSVVNIAPTFGIKTEDWYFDTVWNYLGQGDESISMYPENHHSFYLQAGHRFGSSMIEAQSVTVIDGGLISEGFETFSSVVNSSPSHNKSAIRMKTIGGIFSLSGAKKNEDSELNMIRISYNFSDKLNAKLAGGHFSQYDGKNDTVLDVKLSYQVNSAVTFDAKFGRLMGDTNLSATSVGLNFKY